MMIQGGIVNFKSAMMATLALSYLGLSACSTGQKQRQAERDRVAQSSGLYCEFLNGDDHNDIDVELNLQMARKCDTSKNFSVSSYKNASDIFGMVYCCSANKSALKPAPAPVATPAKPGTPPTKKLDDDEVND